MADGNSSIEISEGIKDVLPKVQRAESKNLSKRIKIERNPEADHLEEVLGITFPRKPSKVPLDLRNRFALYRRSKDMSRSHVRSVSDVLRGNIQPEAWYDSDFHTFFYTPPKKRKEDFLSDETVYHENLHGFIHDVNPELEKELSEATKEAGRLLPDPGVVLRGFCSKALLEGMAEWGGWETVALDHQKKFDDPDTSYEYHRKLNMAYSDATLHLAGGSIEEKEKDLKDKAREELYKFLHIRIIEDPTTLDVEYFYAIGHYFVNEVMHKLRNSGMTRAEAMVFLLKRPPRSVENLINPEKYAEEILAKKDSGDNSTLR